MRFTPTPANVSHGFTVLYRRWRLPAGRARLVAAGSLNTARCHIALPGLRHLRLYARLLSLRSRICFAGCYAFTAPRCFIRCRFAVAAPHRCCRSLPTAACRTRLVCATATRCSFCTFCACRVDVGRARTRVCAVWFMRVRGHYRLRRLVCADFRRTRPTTERFTTQLRHAGTCQHAFALLRCVCVWTLPLRFLANRLHLLFWFHIWHVTPRGNTYRTRVFALHCALHARSRTPQRYAPPSCTLHATLPPLRQRCALHTRLPFEHTAPWLNIRTLRCVA